MQPDIGIGKHCIWAHLSVAQAQIRLLSVADIGSKLTWVAFTRLRACSFHGYPDGIFMYLKVLPWCESLFHILLRDFIIPYHMKWPQRKLKKWVFETPCQFMDFCHLDMNLNFWNSGTKNPCISVKITGLDIHGFSVPEFQKSKFHVQVWVEKKNPSMDW